MAQFTKFHFPLAYAFLVWGLDVWGGGPTEILLKRKDIERSPMIFCGKSSVKIHTSKWKSSSYFSLYTDKPNPGLKLGPKIENEPVEERYSV